MNTHKSNPRANLLVVADVVGLIACLVALVVLALENKLDAATGTALGTFAGFFGLGLRDAHQFEFGSSRGSRDKDAMLLAATPPPKDQASP